MRCTAGRIVPRVCVVAVMAGMLAQEPAAKTPQQRVDELAGLLPAGMKARLAWLGDGMISNAQMVPKNAAKGFSIYVMDSEDGVVRELTPLSTVPQVNGRREIGEPILTHDGGRVIFSRYDTEFHSSWVIDWDGRHLTRLSEYEAASRSWRDPNDGSDWVIYRDRRLCLDDPAKTVAIWDYNAGDLQMNDIYPVSLSADGTHLCGAFRVTEAGERDRIVIGVGKVPAGPLTPLSAMVEGCFSSIAPDNSYDFMQQTGAHEVVRLVTRQGIHLGDTNTTAPVLDWADANQGKHGCDDQREYEHTRWTNHRDYITYDMYATSVNPIIMRLSDKKWIYLNEHSGCDWEGNMSMSIFTPGSTSNPGVPLVQTIGEMQCQVGFPISVSISVKAQPAATLSATGLPDGLSLVAGQVPAASFVLAGIPSQTGAFEVTLTASNSAGQYSRTFTIDIVEAGANVAPSVSLGPDLSVTAGVPTALTSAVEDDGLPNQVLTYLWKVIGGPTGGATLTNATAPVASVNAGIAGSYQVTLTVSDGELHSTDTVQVSAADYVEFRVIAPATGDSIEAGAPCTIFWQIDPSEEGVQIEYSGDGGKTYKEISLTMVLGTSFTWQVPPTLEPGEYLIRLTVYADQGTTARSGGFTVHPPLPGSIRARSVNGPGRTEAIAWQHYAIDGRRLSGSPMRAGTAVVVVADDRGGRVLRYCRECKYQTGTFPSANRTSRLP